MPGLPGGHARPGGEEQARVLVHGLAREHPEDEGTHGQRELGTEEEEMKHKTSVAYLDRNGLTKFWAMCSCGWEDWKNEKIAAEKLASKHKEEAGA